MYTGPKKFSDMERSGIFKDRTDENMWSQSFRTGKVWDVVRNY